MTHESVHAVLRSDYVVLTDKAQIADVQILATYFLPARASQEVGKPKEYH